MKYLIDLLIINFSVLTAQPNLDVQGWVITTTPKWSAETSYKSKDFKKHNVVSSSLIIKCSSKGPVIYFKWGKFMGQMPKKIPIMFERDNLQPYSEYWKITTEYVTMAHYSNKKKVKFLKKLTGVKSLKTRIAPFGTKVLTSEFNVKNSDKVIGYIKTNCPGKTSYWE